MHRLGLVATERRASPSGPERKVYALTEAGRQALTSWTAQWTQFVELINATLPTTASPISRTER
jgi:PadR family transcriptional regulator PadR